MISWGGGGGGGGGGGHVKLIDLLCRNKRLTKEYQYTTFHFTTIRYDLYWEVCLCYQIGSSTSAL